MSNYNPIRLDDVYIKPGTLPTSTWRDFSGIPHDMNVSGQKYFNVELTPEQADILDSELNDRFGLPAPIKRWIPKNNEDDQMEPKLLLKVIVSYRIKEPKVFKLTEKNHRVQIHENAIGELDHVTFEMADIAVTPSKYTDRRTGEDKIAIYLDQMYFRVNSGVFADKYGDDFGYEDDVPEVL